MKTDKSGFGRLRRISVICVSVVIIGYLLFRIIYDPQLVAQESLRRIMGGEKQIRVTSVDILGQRQHLTVKGPNELEGFRMALIASRSPTNCAGSMRLLVISMSDGSEWRREVFVSGNSIFLNNGPRRDSDEVIFPTHEVVLDDDGWKAAIKFLSDEEEAGKRMQITENGEVIVKVLEE